MFSPDSREASRAVGDSLVMKRWKADMEHPQRTASSNASNESLEMSHTTYDPSVSGLQNCRSASFDHTGQASSSATKPLITATLWEDEGCLCFLVDAKGICVARREDNNMINGTKLLNVAGMTRVRRNGILESEKRRHVVKFGPIYLRGVWIPFNRALYLAETEKIAELLYPLFMDDIGSLIDQPSHEKPGHHPESQHKTQQWTEPAKRNNDHIHGIDVLESSDESLRRLPFDAARNHEIHDQGPIGSLYKSLMETLGLVLVETKLHSDMVQHYGSLEKSCAALFFWGNDLGLWRGELDDILQDSPQLRDTCLTVLVSICLFVTLICLISSEHRRKKVLQSTGISTALEQTMTMIEEQHQSTYRPEQDVEALCQTLRTKVDTLVMLAPSLASPAEESFDEEEPRAIEDTEEHLPEQVYASSISQKFPRAASSIVARLGELNWDRYNHMRRLQRETMQQELQATALEKARTIFHDSGLGISLPAQSEVGLKISVDPSRPESVYAPSVVSSRAEASHKRMPKLPAHARAGEPFTCEICNKLVKFRRTKTWKKHVFRDILAYACFFAKCCDAQAFFENAEMLMDHLQDEHGMDVRVSDVTCPLCIEFTSRDRDVLSLHITRHMEEVALAVLPSGVDSDEASIDESVSEVPSNDGYFQEAEIGLQETLERLKNQLGPEHPETQEKMVELAAMLNLQRKHKVYLALSSQLLKPKYLRTAPSRGRPWSSLERYGLVYGEAEAMEQLPPKRLNSPSSTVSSIAEVSTPELEAEMESVEDCEASRYCHCNKVSYGDMIACKNDDCARKLFHLACVGLEELPTGQAQWFCSDNCRDAHDKVKVKWERPTLIFKDLGKHMPLAPVEVQTAVSSDIHQVPGLQWIVGGTPADFKTRNTMEKVRKTAMVSYLKTQKSKETAKSRAGSEGSQGSPQSGHKDTPKPQPDGTHRPSSYWSVSESRDFEKNIENFGTDWIGIANHMGTKTHTMVKNRYLRLVKSGNVYLEQVAKEADARRSNSVNLIDLLQKAKDNFLIRNIHLKEDERSQAWINHVANGNVHLEHVAKEADTRRSSGNDLIDLLERARDDFWIRNAHLKEDERSHAWLRLINSGDIYFEQGVKETDA